MSGSELDDLSEIVAAAAREVRDGRPNTIEAKAADDFVTDLDRRLEIQISERLRIRFPSVPVFGEESLGVADRLPADAFLVDPLDGTSNWISDISFCAISVARVTAGKTVLAAVADVYGNNIYTASLDEGAFKNGIRLQLGGRPTQLFGLSTGLLMRTHASPGTFESLRKFGKLRNLGAQALQLCLVGNGGLAFTASIEAKLWDDAAGRLVACEAGAIYLSGVPEDERNLPFADQRSLIVHPAIAKDVQSILGALLSLGQRERD